MRFESVIEVGLLVVAVGLFAWRGGYPEAAMVVAAVSVWIESRWLGRAESRFEREVKQLGALVGQGEQSRGDLALRLAKLEETVRQLKNR